jgi:AcrR family transcriptional regulator
VSNIAKKPQRKRYSPDERRKLILDGAIDFFAQHGVDGSTHQLARKLNITQPLIYQYFPSKESLIDAVYDELFNGRWNPDWDRLLSDRAHPLAARLLQFYVEYAQVIQAPEWIRIYLDSGLKHLQLNRRYNAIIERSVIHRICDEMRASLGLPGLADLPITDSEFEAVWIMHGGLFYHGVRKHVYQLETTRVYADVIADLVEAFVAGFEVVVRKAVARAG